MITKFEKLLSIKELAEALGKHRNYVGAMKARGFEMPGGTATVTEAREWLKNNPHPRRRPVNHLRAA
jgi:hypothetical protein